MRTAALLSGLMLCAATAGAQNGRPSRLREVRPPARARQVPQRNALEQRFRQRSEEIVRRRLNLNADQVSKLRAVSADISGRRNALVGQERAVRMDLRDEMSKGASADQNRVSQLMAQAHDLQSQRFALQQEEQRQLSGFMSPIQVAQYVGLQAQIRQRIREMQRGQAGGMPNNDLQSNP